MSRAVSVGQPPDLGGALAQSAQQLQGKIFSCAQVPCQPYQARQELSQDRSQDHWLARLQALPRPLVFTNGVFDLLHRGHVECLQAARQLGGSLVVGLNSDASVRRLGKGADRPLQPAQDRAVMLAALSSVDLVLEFDEDTPVDLLKIIQPELYVKGGDYVMEALEETRWVRTWGGQALAIPLTPGFATTALVQKIRRAAQD